MLFRIAQISLVILCLWNIAEANGTWKAGVASINITPEKNIGMSGYGGRNEPAEHKLTDLWAKALVLEDSIGQQAVLVTLDLVGIHRDLSQTLSKTICEKHALERKQLAFCCSHTHTGPVVGQNLAPLHYLTLDARQQMMIDEYKDVLQRKLVRVVDQALQHLEPSHLAWGSGTATFAVNRRNNREKEVPLGRTTGKLNGPFDHDVPVLSIRSPQGSLRAVVFGYACHATVLNLRQWSGDYPGYAQIEIEKHHSGCTALFFAGCGGDQNPLPRRSIELARHYGQRLATAVDTVLLTSTMQPVEGSLQTTYREIDLPFATLPSREQIEKDTESKNKYTATHARMLLDQLGADNSLCPTYPYPIGVWKIGNEIQFVLLSGEVVVDYAIRLKRELLGIKTWVAGYTNDVMAYIPSRRVLLEGGYEGGGATVYYGLPTIWSPLVEKFIVDEVHAQITGK